MPSNILRLFQPSNSVLRLIWQSMSVKYKLIEYTTYVITNGIRNEYKPSSLICKNQQDCKKKIFDLLHLPCYTGWCKVGIKFYHPLFSAKKMSTAEKRPLLFMSNVIESPCGRPINTVSSGTRSPFKNIMAPSDIVRASNMFLSLLLKFGNFSGNILRTLACRRL